MIWLLIPAFVLVVWIITVEVRLDRWRQDIEELRNPPGRTKYEWLIQEADGEWAWSVTSPGIFDYSTWRCSDREVEFQGTTDSRIKAQKAVEQALWKLHKQSILPTIHVGGQSGVWSA